MGEAPRTREALEAETALVEVGRASRVTRKEQKKEIQPKIYSSTSQPTNPGRKQERINRMKNVKNKGEKKGKPRRNIFIN
jgi:hypothetical protein